MQAAGMMSRTTCLAYRQLAHFTRCTTHVSIILIGAFYKNTHQIAASFTLYCIIYVYFTAAPMVTHTPSRAERWLSSRRRITRHAA